MRRFTKTAQDFLGTEFDKIKSRGDEMLTLQRI